MLQHLPILDSLVVRIPACHAGGRGSIPRRGEKCFAKLTPNLSHHLIYFWLAYSSSIILLMAGGGGISDSTQVYCKAWHCIRPYHVESTSSRLITEVKQHWAVLVLGWVTAWEYTVLYTFFLLTLSFLPGPDKQHPIHYRQDNVYGHTMLKAPVLVWSLKLSNIGLC